VPCGRSRAALRQALEGQLSGVKVYRVGDEPEKDVYVVGKAAEPLRAIPDYSPRHPL
jgi:hypothetical protein